ncbi:hypothetical protein BBJ28_00016018 [Nothophytophthora sp. Chile5]|nr:hypothetical protein BBJ28_00016018 [Nothophytophthora sp. Chile5]
MATSTSAAGGLALPDAVTGELLSFLSVSELLALERVDRAWQQTLAPAHFWSHVQLQHEHDSEKIDAMIQQVAGRHGAQVRKLTLVDCTASEGTLVKAGKRFVAMTHLVVSGCQTLSDSGLSALVQASKHQLVEVRAVKCLQLTNASLNTVGECHSQSLERINFSYCRQISADGVMTLVRRCGKLRSIEMKGCPAVNSTVVAVIAESCTALNTLTVGGAGSVTDEALLALAEHCPDLTSLDIARSNPFGVGRGGVTDNALVHFALRCPRLEHLVLCGHGQLSLSVLGSLASSCPKLETLDIGGCREITANPLALGAQLKRMRCLHQLSVAFTRGLKDEHIGFIATQCPQLKTFRVDGAFVAAVHA